MNTADQQPVGAFSPVQIVLDTSSSSPADQRQPDSGSNQSGSDSGLGFSNSISSDNSTANNQQAHQASGALNWDSCPPDVNNNDTDAATTKIPFSKSDLLVNDQASGLCTSAATFHKHQASRKTSAIVTSFLPRDNALERPAASDTGQQQSTATPASTTIKSLLKKPSTKASSLTKSSPDSTGLAKPLKHNRTVSFNQTVIVFCEELETPSPSEQYQPPTESSAFEPPLDYCDLDKEILAEEDSKDDIAQISAHRLPATSSTTKADDSSPVAAGSATVVLNKSDWLIRRAKPGTSDQRSSRRDEHDDDADDDDYYDDHDDHADQESNHYDQEDNDYADTYVNVKRSNDHHLGHRPDPVRAINSTQLISKRAVGNLIHDQMIGLLDDESLLEAFKLNFEDLSEDDFPINHLNSGHGYLCDAAISDYDSDSESSYCYNDDKRDNEKATYRLATNIHPQGTSTSDIRYDHQATGTLENKKTSNVGGSILLRGHQKGVIASDYLNNQLNSKSLPARVKVSTVEANQLKKSVGSRDDIDLKSRIINSRVANDSAQSNNQTHIDTFLTDKPRQTNSIQQTSRDQPNSYNLVKDRLIPVESRAAFNSNKARSNNESAQSAAAAAQQSALQSICSESADRNQLSHGLPTQLSVPQPLMLAQQAMVNMTRNHPACHMCRAMETSRSQTNLNNGCPISNNNGEISSANLANIDQCNKFMTASKQVQPQIIAQNHQTPPIFNQSCLSCQEASLQQRNQSQPLQPLGPSFGQPLTRPVAYQVVHLVDQNGNRIRALSLVRPGQDGQQLVAGRRYVLAHPPSRPPNLQTAETGDATQQRNLNAQTGTVSGDTNQRNLRLLSSGQNQQLIPGTITAQQQIAAKIQAGKLASHNLIPRQPGVYYVQQPLSAQSIRQIIQGSVTKTFPDPHEIRRLDGIKAPALSMNVGIETKNEQNCSQSVTGSRNVNFDRHDENDDPTFGFSNRPSVKVVTHNFPPSNQSRTVGIKTQLEASQSDGSIGNKLKTGVAASEQSHNPHIIDRLNCTSARDSMLSTNSMTSIRGETWLSTTDQGVSSSLATSSKSDSHNGKGLLTNGLRCLFNLKHSHA